MAAVDMKAWYTQLEAKLLELKEKFIESMVDDEEFFDTWGSDPAEAEISITGPTFGHGIEWRDELKFNLKPVNNLVRQIEALRLALPEKPAALLNGTVERNRTHIFSDARLDNMETALRNIYASVQIPSNYDLTGQSLTEQIQAVLYDHHYHRDREQLIDQIDTLANEWAGDGYNRAPGALGYGVSQIINDHDLRRTESTAAIFKDLANQVQQNIQYAFEHGISIEALHMDFTIEYSEISKVYIEAAVNAYIAEIDKRSAEQRASLLLFDETIKALSLDTEADIKKHQLELSENQARLSAYVTATNQFIEAEAAKIVEQLRLANNLSEGFGGIFASYGSMFTGVSYEE